MPTNSGSSRITLREVAEAARVHPGTASRALNPETRGLVNEETAQRVLRAADELGYRPNPIARGLKTNRSYTIGVLIPDLMNPLFPPIVRGIQDRLEQAGYTPLIANTDNDPERERIDFERLRARQVDGFIAATARRDDDLLIEVAAIGTRSFSSTAASSRRAYRRWSETTARGCAWRSSTSPTLGTGGSPIWPAPSRSRPAISGTRGSSRRCANATCVSTPS